MTDTPSLSELQASLADIEHDIQTLKQQCTRAKATDAISAFRSELTKKQYLNEQIYELNIRRDDLLRQIETAKQEATP